MATALRKFRVAYASFPYSDGTGTARLHYRNVKAENAEEAREVLRARQTVGSRFNLRYIGMVYDAEEIA